MIKNFVLKHVCFNVSCTTLIAIAVLLLIYPCVKFLPDRFGWENGLLENIQMLVLFISCYLAYSAKSNKRFFNFVIMVLVILILREINCGRTLLFPIPDVPNAFYSVNDLRNGTFYQRLFASLVHPVYGLYMFSVFVYFVRNKLWNYLYKVVKYTAFPLWDILMMLIGIAVGMYAEKACHNNVFEEIAELLFYLSLMSIIYIYTRNKNYEVAEE